MWVILVLVVPVLLGTVQVGHGAVVVKNTSAFNVTVYDTNTTIIIDTLEPNQMTSFPLDTAGPDLFLVTNENKPGSFSVLVSDGYELLLYGNNKLSHKTYSPLQPAPAPAPSSNSRGAASAPSSNSGGGTSGG